MYSIGEISKMFDLPISTLRYYDKEGLFPRLKRVNGVRKFSENEIETLRVIDCLKRSGLEIKDIKEYMNLCSLGNSTLKQRKEIFVKQKEEVLQEMEKLQKVLYFFSELKYNADIKQNRPQGSKQKRRNAS